jgi:hypothetical protein
MTFVSGSSTPFGFFDGDAQFQVDANRVVTYVTRKLGESQLQVELDEADVFACFEDAVMEFSATVNSYQAKSVLHSLLGQATGTLSGMENTYPRDSLEWARRQAEAYNEQVALNSHAPLYGASIDTAAGQQTYDLQALMNPTGSDGQPRRMIITQIMHMSPLSSFRFYGTTSFMNYLNNEFRFESFTPETLFYLLPVWEDVLRGMQFETSNRVRRSNYSYALHNNVLTLYPPPSTSTKLWFTYRFVESPVGAVSGTADPTTAGVANLSNVPFGHIQYSKVNSIGRQWIWRMTLAMSKEVLGYVRRKMGSVPIPDGTLNLDGPELVADARQEMEQLRTELKSLLDDMTYDKLAQREAEKARALDEVMSKLPLKIFVG